MPGRALIAIGVGQCISWGVLYYAFAVLVVPLQRELGVDTWVVTGAFSGALLMSALLAPAVGRWGDRGHGPLVMQAGGAAAAGLLLAWTILPGLVSLYLVWAGLGLCMAALLYEPAFAIVGRAYADPAARLRALAAVTLFGGLASTVFLPATAFLETALGWRGAVSVLALVLGLSLVLVRTLAFRALPVAASRGPGSLAADRTRSPEPDPVRFAWLAAIFTAGTIASGALAANLVPALGERGITPAGAALLGGLMGAMQLPGRALLMHGRFAGSPALLLGLSLALHAAGLALIAFGGSTPAVAAGTLVFALGAGLTTLVRPYVVQTLFSLDRGGALNGRIARQQQLARAVGPILVAWLASRSSYSAVLAVLAAIFVLAIPAAAAALNGRSRSAAGDEAACV